MVFDEDYGNPPASYTGISSIAGYVTEDSFAVGAAAIPEFPTIVTVIVISGMCLGIYCWMRRRRAAVVKS
ncbi:hypothetical protein ACFLTS_04750 [Chloroflexota bacterium]